MIIELHLLQAFPVSNLNRDDLGQPKTASMGGHTRARISSQCLKRSARTLFTDYGLDKSEVGIRTKRLLDSTERVLTDAGREPELARAVTTTALEQLGFGVDEAKGLTQYLLFVSNDTVEHLAQYCQSNWEALAATAAAKTGGKQAKVKPDKAGLAEVKRILDASRAADIAMFGRMIADNKDLNVDAASQVAHAVSTHTVATEFDFYTAVDDLKPQDESGADMIGTIDFNSACYYRYANLDLDRLDKNLQHDGDLVRRATKAWLHAFINAVPSGKQNSMAARTMPETLLGVTRDRGAWNLANAFQKPVTDNDVMEASTQRLFDHFARLRTFYGTDDLRSATAATVSGEPPVIDGVDTAATIDQFVKSVMTGAGA